MAQEHDDGVAGEVARWFPAEQHEAVWSELSRYGHASHEREVTRVHRAILALSRGDVSRLRHNVDAARRDYRDVLYWAEYPDEREPGLAEMDDVLDSFGDR